MKEWSRKNTEKRTKRKRWRRRKKMQIRKGRRRWVRVSYLKCHFSRVILSPDQPAKNDDDGFKLTSLSSSSFLFLLLSLSERVIFSIVTNEQGSNCNIPEKTGKFFLHFSDLMVHKNWSHQMLPHFLVSWRTWKWTTEIEDKRKSERKRKERDESSVRVVRTYTRRVLVMVMMVISIIIPHSTPLHIF